MHIHCLYKPGRDTFSVKLQTYTSWKIIQLFNLIKYCYYTVVCSLSCQHLIWVRCGGESCIRHFMPPTHMPLMTPSGLSMGMILKIKASRRLWATGSLLHKNSRVPFITQLALDSPGWTRPVSTIQGRLPGQRQTEPVDTTYFMWRITVHRASASCSVTVTWCVRDQTSEIQVAGLFLNSVEPCQSPLTTKLSPYCYLVVVYISFALWVPGIIQLSRPGP